jgi:hypothetical protein
MLRHRYCQSWRCHSEVVEGDGLRSAWGALSSEVLGWGNSDLTVTNDDLINIKWLMSNTRMTVERRQCNLEGQMQMNVYDIDVDH